MISAQIDELRELAGDGSMEWVAGPVRASVLRGAADIILELRDDLQRANAENAKLRELCHDLRKEYAYLRARPRRFYVQHEARMAAIDARMRDLGVEVDG